MIGAQIGAYRIVEQIGAGGMGSVWLAHHTSLERRAAIKVLHASFAQQPEIVARFFNEARAAAAISDPGIVQIFDFGQHTDGTPYIVMELLDGEPLDKRLARMGSLPVGDALRIMRQVASSLGVAHARGITHRDLKPENIFVVRDPEVAGGERAKIVDFGIAKLNRDRSGVKTQTSAMMGTPTYMSPEQCRGAGGVDQRSDVYSLGCVLFTLIVGRPPFEAEGVGDIIAMHLREPAPAPSALRAGVPFAVDQLIGICLAKDPAQRHASGSELAAAIVALLQHGSIANATASTSHPGAVFATPTSPTTLGSSASSLVVARSPRRHAIAIAAGLTLGIGAGVTAIVVRSGGGRPEAVRVAPEPAPAVAEPVEPPAAAPAPSSQPPPAVDPMALATPRLAAALETFTSWSASHAGAPCPTASELALDPDPWGTPLEVTCTVQPRKQRVGVISAGPDRTMDTDDDIASWRLAPEVTALVRGEPWVAAAEPRPEPRPRAPKPPRFVPPKPPAPAPAPARPSARQTPGFVDEDGDGIPDRR